MKCLSKSLKVWLKFIYVSFSHINKYTTIVLIVIVFVISSLQNPDSSVRNQSYSQIWYNCIHKYCTIVLKNDCITHPVFWEPWLIRQDPIVFKKILYSPYDLYFSRLIRQYPMQILFKSYPDLSVRIQLWYYLAYWLNILSQSTPLNPGLDSSELSKPDHKAPLI